jgi:hypothetical protein
MQMTEPGSADCPPGDDMKELARQLSALVDTASTKLEGEQMTGNAICDLRLSGQASAGGDVLSQGILHNISVRACSPWSGNWTRDVCPGMFGTDPDCEVSGSLSISQRRAVSAIAEF